MNFQPSQLAILSGILLLALILTDYRRLPPLLMLALCGAAAGLPCLLIIIQPDLGSVLVWGPVFLAMIFVAGLPKRHLALMGLGALFALPVALLVLKPYQLARLLIFRNPDEDPLGEGWSILQCLTAIGSGGFSGKGFLAHGTQNELGFLPASVAHNDFIFAVIGEQFGFQGGILLIAAFALLLLSSLYIASQSRDRLGLLLAIGVTSLLFAHVFMNIGMTIQLTPITGLPLPLVSYGGTFAVLVLFCLGLLQSIWIHRDAGQSEPLPDSEHVLDLSLQSLPSAPVNR
jgi:rod shape determining protein RodA